MRWWIKIEDSRIEDAYMHEIDASHLRSIWLESNAILGAVVNSPEAIVLMTSHWLQSKNANRCGTCRLSTYKECRRANPHKSEPWNGAGPS